MSGGSLAALPAALLAAFPAESLAESLAAPDGAPPAALAGLAAWLASTGPAVAMRANAWLYPAVETAHILGFVLLVGAVAMFDLRVLGFGRALPPRELARHLLPWSAGSLLVVVPSGLLLFSAQAAEMVRNPVFLLKMGLVMVAGSNALAFHLGPWWRSGGAGMPTVAARVHAAVSLLVWIAVITCGRMLAYV